MDDEYASLTSQNNQEPSNPKPLPSSACVIQYDSHQSLMFLELCISNSETKVAIAIDVFCGGKKVENIWNLWFSPKRITITTILTTKTKTTTTTTTIIIIIIIIIMITPTTLFHNDYIQLRASKSCRCPGAQRQRFSLPRL